MRRVVDILKDLHYVNTSIGGEERMHYYTEENGVRCPMTKDVTNSKVTIEEGYDKIDITAEEFIKKIGFDTNFVGQKTVLTIQQIQAARIIGADIVKSMLNLMYIGILQTLAAEEQQAICKIRYYKEQKPYGLVIKAFVLTKR